MGKVQSVLFCRSAFFIGLNMIDRFVTIQELVAKHCSVSEDLVRYWIRYEGLPVYRGSKRIDSRKGKVLIRLSVFYDWMEERRRQMIGVESNIHPRAMEIYEQMSKAR